MNIGIELIGQSKQSIYASFGPPELQLLGDRWNSRGLAIIDYEQNKVSRMTLFHCTHGKFDGNIRGVRLGDHIDDVVSLWGLPYWLVKMQTDSCRYAYWEVDGVRISVTISRIDGTHSFRGEFKKDTIDAFAIADLKVFPKSDGL